MDLTYYLIVGLTVIALSSPVTGGLCWMSMTSAGRCRKLHSQRMSRKKCCSLGHPSISWSPQKHATSRDLISWLLLDGGAPKCTSCNTTCDNVKCPNGRECRMRQGEVACLCFPACSRAMKRRGRVCGSDRHTYRNYCALLRHNCRHSIKVQLSYFGSCKDSCDEVKCAGNDLHCVRDNKGMPHCVRCNTRCPRSRAGSRLCGADGITYGSFCHLVSAICRKGEGIKVAHRGACKDYSSKYTKAVLL